MHEYERPWTSERADTLVAERDPQTRETDGAPPAGTPPRTGDAPRPRPRWWHYVAMAAAGALGAAAVVVPGVFLDGAPAGSSTGEQVVRIDSGDSLVSAIAQQVSPSVARIDVSGPQGRGAGSGVIYSADGYVVTNAHVVAPAAQGGEIDVTLPDGQRLSAELVGADPRSDLAVLDVDASDLPVPAFATDTPEIGETAVAIGSPFGLDGSVTSGIISALNRTVTGPDAPLVDMLQTDAAINPGNSGGALVDDEGQVVGINTAIASPSGANAGVGFAIPMGTVRSVADQLIETGEVRHAFLGITGQSVDPDVSELYGLPADQGAVVAAVQDGSPAADAGLRRGDIVTAVDGEPVTSMPELAGQIQSHQPGDTITLTVVREGEELELEVTLAERPDDLG